MNLPGYTSTTRRDRPVHQEGPLGPWAATVTVTPLQLRREVSFEVCAEWFGPPAAFAPPDPNPGLRQDVYAHADLEFAKALAGHAAVELRAARVPDLSAIARDLKSRLSGGPYG